MGIKIGIYLEGAVKLPYQGLTKRESTGLLKNICRFSGLEQAQLSLVFTDKEYMQNINREFRKKDRPTDIITFSYDEQPFPEQLHIGLREHDIFISLPVAYENSIEYGVEFIDEIKRLMVHGVLHLLGYDHEISEEEEQLMREKEEEILVQL